MACWKTVGWADTVVKTGASSQADSWDGEGGNLIWVIETPWWEVAAGGGDVKDAASGDEGDATGPWLGCGGA